jgi:hypothetical protein
MAPAAATLDPEAGARYCVAAMSSANYSEASPTPPITAWNCRPQSLHCGRCPGHAESSSVYVKNGITTWLAGWKQKGWKTAARKPVKNVDLWQALDAENQRHDVQWHWVKGHSGHPENERADQLANKGIDALGG